MLGGCGERGREVEVGDFSWEESGGDWLGLGSSVAFDGMQIESVVFSYRYRGVK
jgi:hypothetical protein